MAAMKRFLIANYSLHNGELVQVFTVATTPYQALLEFIKPENIDEFSQAYPTVEQICNEYGSATDQWYSVADLETSDIYS